jgi:hypothetical protein
VRRMEAARAVLVSSAALALGVGALAAAAGSSPASTAAAKGGPVTVNKWYVARVQRARIRVRHGRWHDCGTYQRANVPTHQTCSIAKTQFHTFHSTVSGNLELPEGVLSASVGYDVGESVTYTNSYTVDIPAHHYGELLFRASWNNRKRVEQDEKKWGHGHFFGPVLARRWVTTEEVAGPQFRVNDHR